MFQIVRELVPISMLNYSSYTTAWGVRCEKSTWALATADRELADGTVLPPCEKLLFYEILHNFTLKVAWNIMDVFHLQG